MAKLSIIVKEPGKTPKHIKANVDLKRLQKLVGGYIETFYPVAGGVMIVNEEGAINGMPVNCKVDGINLFGSIVWAGVDDDGNWTDCPVSWADAKAAYPQMFDA